MNMIEILGVMVFSAIIVLFLTGQLVYENGDFKFTGEWTFPKITIDFPETDGMTESNINFSDDNITGGGTS